MPTINENMDAVGAWLDTFAVRLKQVAAVARVKGPKLAEIVADVAPIVDALGDVCAVAKDVLEGRALKAVAAGGPAVDRLKDSVEDLVADARDVLASAEAAAQAAPAAAPAMPGVPFPGPPR